MKVISFAKKAEEKNIDNMADKICETYRRMGIQLTEKDKSRIKKRLSSGICKGVLTVRGMVSSVPKEEK